MADKTPTSNALLTTKAPEAALSVQLHPLVLLTISDYITRHISRQQTGPIVGAIIGQQNGRSFTLEHAYECKTIDSSGFPELDAPFFHDRLEQYKDVHKAPALDLVGLFMLGPVAGPGESHAQFVLQAQKLSASDPVMLLLFHPELVEGLSGGRLPISLYESVRDGEASSGEGELKFRELAFEVETGEAEMIGVDFVATGAGIATAEPMLDSSAPVAGGSSSDAPPSAAEASGKEGKKTAKGKGKAKDDDTSTTNGTSAPTAHLSPEDEELLASLTAKANAIKMLTHRLHLIRSYLSAQPPSYLTDASLPLPSTSEETNAANHTLLRSIQALLSRLPLLAPPPSPSTSVDQSGTAAGKEKQDVQLTSLLAGLTRAVAEAQTLGGKFHVVSRERANKERGQVFGAGAGRGRLGFGEDSAILHSAEGMGF